MPKPTKKKNGRWRVQVYLGKDENGKSIIKTITADTKEECMYKASVLKHQGMPKYNSKLLVRDAVEQYINSIDGVIVYSTLRGYKTILNNYYPSLMAMPVSSLTNVIVQTEINKEAKRITRHGETVAPKTVKNGWGLIKTALKRVCHLEFDVKLPQVEIETKVFPTADKIINALKGTNSELPCLLAVWMGLRMEEIKGIDCSAIKDGILYIRQVRYYKQGKEYVKITTKNDKSTRNLAIPDYIMALIESTEEWQNYAETGENQPLITTTRNRIYKRWKRICDANGWDMTFHDLRAVNASIGLKLNVPDKWMMDRNGYKTDYTLKKIYQNMFSDSRLAADKTIDDFFVSILG